MAENKSTANIGFEETLWKAADKLRGSMSSYDYKDVVLGLMFLKYISDKFETRYNELVEEGSQFEEDIDEYTEHNIFWVPQISRWNYIRDNAKSNEVGQIIDDAMIEIEKENPTLLGVLDKRYARPELDKRRVGELIDLISTIKLHSKEQKDLLGRVYEYFLGQFASAEGKNGGEFYTPASIVKTLVQMIEPYKGRIYDPACGSGGMFIQSEKFVEEHKGKLEDLSIYGQELNSTTWKLCRMNLVIRGLDGNIGQQQGDTFHNDMHKMLKADFVLANPPFNIKDWGGNSLVDDIRWKFGIPPEGNANYAWLQHIVHHLAPNGCAGVVLANGSLSSNTSNEGVIRKDLIENDLVDAIVAMPDKLFYSTGIPVCLWILNRNKGDNPKFRNREKEILFIDARNLGDMIDRKHRELSDDDVKVISQTYHNYRNIGNAELKVENGKCNDYEDVKGFCKIANIDDVKENDYILTPGRYVGIEDVIDEGVSFDEKMETLTSELDELFKESRNLEDEIRKNLGGIGYEF
ncbi:SAM-dependent DNA methyltransferase [Clostridium gasigenes]|uniref:class I SAM-dependent DNA methyltransferase n=1 Tax=Clostridium gasigenes TaxID=94869 RepID=UPI00162587B2|nr:class I SAM-dependent DNA methyltransferase [Clostridium gasigenes]MBB6625094.1 SAM-dependent DNA methyltransferase [Clostridium gasigenes]MBU3138032.1 type I restriction-modification system subunit M [Clostridium gasigenes]